MSQIEVTLYDQTAIFTNTPDIFSGDIDVDIVKFTFDNSWNVYNKKTAIFYNDPKKSYPVFLDDTNTAVIPSELIDRGTKLYFGVIGTNSNSEVKTSSILSYRIERGAISADVEIPPASAEIWLQILLNYEIALKNLQDMSNNLENMNDILDEMNQRFIDANVENKANIDLSNITDDATNALFQLINMDNLPDGTTYHKVPFLVQAGTVTKASPMTVTFPVAYKTAPVVVCTPYLAEGSGTSLIGSNWYLKTKATTTGITIYTGTTQSIDGANWVAFGITESGVSIGEAVVPAPGSD